MLKILCEKGTKFVSRCRGLLLEDFGAIARRFDESRKLMILQPNPDITCILKIPFRYLCRVSQQLKIFHAQLNFFMVD